MPETSAKCATIHALSCGIARLVRFWSQAGSRDGMSSVAQVHSAVNPSHNPELPAPEPPPTAKNEAWWESKLLLLVVGAVLTSFIAPRIQDQIETIKWQRQQQVDEGVKRLSAIQGFLTDLAELQARCGEMETLSVSAVNPNPRQIPVRDFQTKFDIALVGDWHRHSAKVTGQLAGLP